MSSMNTSGSPQTGVKGVFDGSSVEGFLSSSFVDRVETLRDSANLDLLRAIAVMSVYVDHLFTTLGVKWIGPFSVFNLGRGGVLLFFVHTCLVLMMSMDRLKPRTTNMISDFYTRRAFRIYPLSMLFVAAIALFHIPQAPWRPEYHWPGAKHFISNLMLTQNLTSGTSSMLAPLWSLPFEVQMYIFLPFIYLAVKRRDRLSYTFIALALAAVLGIIQPYVSSRARLVTFVPCFIGGILAYQLAHRRVLHLSSRAWPILIIGLLAAYMYTDKPYRLVPGWLVCLVLGIAIPQFREIKANWLKKTSHLVAKYSYGIYLSHVVAMWIAFILLKQHSTTLQWSVLAILSVLMPILAYHLAEQPMIVLGSRICGRIWGVKQAPLPSSASRDLDGPTANGVVAQ